MLALSFLAVSHASAVDIREGRAISFYVRTRIITRRMLISATTLLVVSILCIVSYLLVREYRNTEQEATRSAFNLVQLIDREVRNTVSLYDTALMSLISFFQSHALDSFPQPLQNTLLFHKASDLPVYATSHVFSASGNQDQYNDMNGVRFCETPWLLEPGNPLRQQVAAQWPQAAGSLGRLYAMGVDAYTLTSRLGQLKALPDSRIDGLSGSLGMSPTQHVERQLPWAEFVNGQVQRLPDTPN